MDHCPFILKRKGLTLIELLVVLSFIGFMAMAVVATMNPATQLSKARDARRKSDLQKIKNPLEDYYNDNKCYPTVEEMNCDPGTNLRPYWSKVPCDPLTNTSYYYERPSCDVYRIYVKLDYSKDLDIAKSGCSSGCGPGGAYNYGISSSNTKLERSEPVATVTQTPPVQTCAGRWSACQWSECNEVPEDSPLNPKFCNDDTCGGTCE
jgi:prepilin-type N-terminal cleavage/methylation domain-containing protein